MATTASPAPVPVAVRYLPVAVSLSAIRSRASTPVTVAAAPSRSLDPVQRGHLVRHGAAVPVAEQRVLQRARPPRPSWSLRDRAAACRLLRSSTIASSAVSPVEGAVRRAVEHVGRDVGVRPAVRVELAEPEPDRQDVPDRLVDVGDGDQAPVERGLAGWPTIGAALLSSTVKLVHARLEHVGVRLVLVVVVVLGLRHGVRGPGVADVVQRLVGPRPHDLVEVPVDVGRAAVDLVVRRHHAGRRVGRDGWPERGLVVLVLDPRRARWRS